MIISVTGLKLKNKWAWFHFWRLAIPSFRCGAKSQRKFVLRNQNNQWRATYIDSLAKPKASKTLCVVWCAPQSDGALF